MIVVPLWLSGTVSVALIVVLGIFVFPWLLTRRGGGIAVSVATALLVALFVAFQRGSDAAAGTAALIGAGLAGCAPAIVAFVVRRLQGSG